VPDEQFRTEAAVPLEEIHRNYATELESFNGDIEPFAPASERLSNFHGNTESRTNVSKLQAFLPMIVFVILLIASIALIVWALNR